MKKKIHLLLVLMLLLMAVFGCQAKPTATKPAAEKLKRETKPAKSIILATTTSTQDTGLLDVLAPAFKKLTGIDVKVIAVGTGEAIAMGEKGEADVLLVHSKDAEEKFVADGFGLERVKVMHNFFVLVGPEDDPARAKGAAAAADAFKAIAAAKATFVTRGDDSGTHKKELKIWDAAGIKPAGDWYVSTGQGMGETLQIAGQKKAYTLSDTGTFLSTKAGSGLVEILGGTKDLLNQYSVILVNPANFPKVKAEGARKFQDFLISEDTQKLIGEFGAEKYGQALFTPDAVPGAEKITKE